MKRNEDVLQSIGYRFSIYQEIMENTYDERKLVINDSIDDTLLEDVCLAILEWNKEDIDIPVEKRKKIHIYINSGGGDVIMGRQILSTIKTSKTPIITVGFSKCASMASYILAAGSKRYCFPDTVVLLHDGQSGYYASSNKGKDIQKFYDALDERQKKFMIENTAMTEEFLEDIKDREYYMFSEEAKELGIVDEIIGVDCSIDEIL